MADTHAAEAASLKTTPLHALHIELGAKMVPFAGYDMPVQYPSGVLAEHLHTREKAGLFDVSHMGQAFLRVEGAGSGDEAHERVAAAIETIVPGDIKGLRPGQIRYTLLLNEQGGILDDLMVTRPLLADQQGTLVLVVNAATKDADFAHIESSLAGRATLHRADDRALIALQGPAAEAVMRSFAPAAADLGFMELSWFEVEGAPVMISRSGYTGEDGFEISVPNDRVVEFARTLLAHPDVKPIGLGARDSLRLEAGLCLYGHDIDETTTPIEAALGWVIPKRRREEGGFPGASVILDQIGNGAGRKRVGLLPEGKAPAREGTAIVDGAGNHIGTITSGGFGPTAGGPVAMGYVDTDHAKIGTEVALIVRGVPRPAKVASMPFIEKRFHRTDKK